MINQSVLLLVAALLACTGESSAEGLAMAKSPMNRHLTVDDHTRDILQHPAFAGFAELVLPSSGGLPSGDTPLNQIGSLLPYHSQVNPQEAVAALNRTVDDANSGKAVFHNFYSAAQRQQDPTKTKTGLFFFRGPAGAPFAMIAPGGGFSYVGTVHEGFPYALEINRKGYTALVLTYRVGQGGAAATEDLVAALSYVLRNAGRLGVAIREPQVSTPAKTCQTARERTSGGKHRCFSGSRTASSFRP